MHPVSIWLLSSLPRIVVGYTKFILSVLSTRSWKQSLAALLIIGIAEFGIGWFVGWIPAYEIAVTLVTVPFLMDLILRLVNRQVMLGHIEQGSVDNAIEQALDLLAALALLESKKGLAKTSGSSKVVQKAAV